MTTTEVQETPKEKKADELVYSYLDSFKLYFSFKPIKFYEDKLLSYLPFYPEPTSNRRSETVETVIDAEGNFIHEFYVENTDPPVGDPIEVVLVHGYGAALGFFYKNMEGLSSIPGTKIHAIDMLGFGLSSRPPFPNLKEANKESVYESEAFFIDSLESWRKARGLKKFILMGHSLGGYLSCAYYLKYGDGVVEKLIMVSPVGIERNDVSLSNEANADGHERTLEEDTEIAQTEGVDLTREIDGDNGQDAQEFKESTSDHPVVDDSISITSDAETDEYLDSMVQVRSAPKLSKFFVRLWESHCSPFQILRVMGPISSKYISRWTFSRFGEIDNPEELLDISNYTSKILLGKGSGEYALTRILAPGALARLPMLDRIPKNIKVKSLWMYGDVDWMSKEAGYQMVKEINQYNKDDDTTRAKFRIIKHAGHHLYIDNAESFENQVLKFFRP
ncbi:hypothetical protein CANARDRAFT_7161 [[Candida] arabinofermentans NRRL YB-2248]|uniref:AB hydrolase-1 domain-containing protein n=1 Tax=[Candida] arabinofermentans NRRL YB-2248 TaxID=983967 RepID=A0A1E4T238_9ASCO|nr:hypothetical protein CANARDRAFT_7161 [[Candida] arabinofermentans NRRL YB-2248]